ncbi:hypothetical protein BsWGS_15167 [Bradybaena similaris]
MSTNLKFSVAMISVAVTGVALFYFLPTGDNSSTFHQKLHEDQGTLKTHLLEAKDKKERVLAAIQQQAGLSVKDK